MTAEPLAPTGTLTVLVIDDEPQIRRLVSNALTADALLGADGAMRRRDVCGRARILCGAVSRPRPRQSLTDAPT